MRLTHELDGECVDLALCRACDAAHPLVSGLVLLVAEVFAE